jgi:hypothetical protein
MLFIFLKHAFVESFSIHAEGLETERQLSVATFSSGKRIAQALTDGMMEWEWNVQEEDGFEVGEAADGSGLMRRTIRIPDNRCFHHVMSYYTASDARTLAWPSRMLECQIDAASNPVQQALCPHVVQVM